jgi:hypothetical protein
VSRHTPRRRARIDQLADELTVGAAFRLRCDSDDIHDVVRAVVEYLIEEYPAQDLYIPSSLGASAYPVEEMRAALESGESARSVCRKFRVSRRTLYALLDQPKDAVA